MKTKTVDNAKLGAFVLAGIIFLIVTLYMIGKNRNLLGSTFTIKAEVNNVNGLVPGNNVRFKGIDVGTVKSIDITNDTLIYVTMTIEEGMKLYIKQNALASIGTDGLMGNKLININSQPGIAPSVEEGSIIQSRKPVETDEMLRTLNTTNNNMERVTHNLYEISDKLNSSKSLWTLLSDTIVTQDLRSAVVSFKSAGANTADVTAHAKKIVIGLENGNGPIYKLFKDSTLSYQLTNSIQQIQNASRETSYMMKDLRLTVDSMKQGKGTAGLILRDTSLRNSLFNTAKNLEQGTQRFNENMEAMRTHVLFRGYFKKMDKQQKEVSKSKN